MGDHDVTLIASDGKDDTLQTFTINVLPAGANAFPLVFSTPPNRVRLGSEYIYVVEAVDPNGDPLEIRLDTAPAGMAIDQSGITVVRWIPTSDQVGSHPLAITVDDGRGGVVTQNATIEVITFADNAPPRIISNPVPFAVVDAEYRYDVRAVDPNGDTVIYTLEQGSLGMSINNFTGALRWEPTQSQLGEHEVIVEARDAQGGVGRQKFTVTVRPVNSPPQFITTPPTVAVAGKLYAYGIGATDPDGDPVRMALVAGPSGMSLDSETGVILWRPLGSQLGTHNVELQIQDPQGASASQSYSIEVLATAENLPPRITTTPPLEGRVNAPYVYAVGAVDPEAGPVTFRADRRPYRHVARYEHGPGAMDAGRRRSGRPASHDFRDRRRGRSGQAVVHRERPRRESAAAADRCTDHHGPAGCRST